MIYEDLNDAERKALLIMKSYEDVRRKGGQVGYKCFPSDDPETFYESALFKQFVTVSEWITEQGWDVTWKQSNWMGYISHVFQKFKPAVPQPGQLKNIVLLKEYCNSAANIVPDGMPAHELEQLYERIIRPELRGNMKLQQNIGIKRK